MFSKPVYSYYKYSDSQKKRYNSNLSGYTCGSHTRAARAYHYQNLV